MGATLEVITQAAVLAFYLAAAVMALIAHSSARLWARRFSAIGLFIISAGWIVFYVVVVDPSLTSRAVHSSVLWSRVMHLVTATVLFVVAFVLRRSERYGVDLALSRGPAVDG